MEGLTVGRNVHYVAWIDGEGGGHLAAFVIGVVDKEKGIVELYVVPPSGSLDNFKTIADYNAYGTLHTWHWIEKA